MAEYLVQDTTMKAIADAIRSKGNTSASLTPAGMASAIGNISTGVETGDATATASDILSGKTAYAKGSKITGTIASKSSSDLTASGATVTVPAGHYASQATKSVSTATQATPSISVGSDGKITASATQTAGYVAAGTKSATKQLTTQAAQTITPGTSAKTAVAAGVYTTGEVKVAGDADLKANNIRKGVNIFGVAGTLVDVEGVEYIEVTPTTASLTLEVTYTIDSRPSAAMVLLKESSTSTGVYSYYYIDATSTKGCTYGGSAGLSNYTTGVVCTINESAHTITFSSGSTSRKFFTKPYRVYIFRNG